MTEVGRVAGLWRYPVKSMAAEALEEVEVSWHGLADGLSALQARVDRLSAIPASFYKLLTWAAKGSDELAPLALLKSLGTIQTLFASPWAICGKVCRYW